MSRFFGQSKSSAASKPTLNDTAAILDSRVETLNKQISTIDQELQAYARLPPARKTSQKARAMALLNKKRTCERQRATIEGQSANINATNFAVNNVKEQQLIYRGLQDANQQLAKGYKNFKVDDVDDLMADLDDHIRDQDEMNDVFSRPIGQDAYTNDADLESELAGLSEQEYGMESNYMHNTIHAPSVPVQPVNIGNTSIRNTKNGQMVDEYGLPRLPTYGMRN